MFVNVMKRVFISAFAFLATGLVLFFIITIMNLTDGVNGKGEIHGTYLLNDDQPDRQTFLTIDDTFDTYYHFRSTNQLMQEGRFTNDDFCILFKDDTKSVYGKIIKSYKKIYFIDAQLNITTYDKVLNTLVTPY